MKQLFAYASFAALLSITGTANAASVLIASNPLFAHNLASGESNLIVCRLFNPTGSAMTVPTRQILPNGGGPATLAHDDCTGTLIGLGSCAYWAVATTSHSWACRAVVSNTSSTTAPTVRGTLEIDNAAGSTMYASTPMR